MKCIRYSLLLLLAHLALFPPLVGKMLTQIHMHSNFSFLMLCEGLPSLHRFLKQDPLFWLVLVMENIMRFSNFPNQNLDSSYIHKDNTFKFQYRNSLFDQFCQDIQLGVKLLQQQYLATLSNPYNFKNNHLSNSLWYQQSLEVV